MKLLLKWLQDLHRMRQERIHAAPPEDLVLFLLDEPVGMGLVATGLFSLSDDERTALRQALLGKIADAEVTHE